MISLKCCQLSKICIHINSYSALKTSNDCAIIICRDGDSDNYGTTHQLTSTDDDEPHYMKVSAL